MAIVYGILKYSSMAVKRLPALVGERRGRGTAWALTPGGDVVDPHGDWEDDEDRDGSDGLLGRGEDCEDVHGTLLNLIIA